MTSSRINGADDETVGVAAAAAYNGHNSISIVHLADVLIAVVNGQKHLPFRLEFIIDFFLFSIISISSEN